MHEPAAVQSLPVLPALGGVAQPDAVGSRWVFGTVRWLLCPPVAHRQAAQGCAAGHAGGSHSARRSPIQSRVFAGPEGMGCPLSLEERIIADECANEPMSWEK